LSAAKVNIRAAGSLPKKFLFIVGARLKTLKTSNERHIKLHGKFTTIKTFSSAIAK